MNCVVWLEDGRWYGLVERSQFVLFGVRWWRYAYYHYTLSIAGNWYNDQTLLTPPVMHRAMLEGAHANARSKMKEGRL
jgi:hypothetical protein